jgi:16S rRNA (guanine966-N2)-methyltransferase
VVEKAPLDEVYPYSGKGWEEGALLRVIAGAFKGRKLTPPKGLSIRPTPDKVKGAIFNILGERIIESSFLDLFAGTGAVGIEALSRGAKEVIFADNSIKAINLVKENTLRFQIPNSKFQIVRADSIEIIKKFSPSQFDLIFLDPPYKSDLGEKALLEISNHNILKEDGEVIWEHYYKSVVSGQWSVVSRLQLKRTIRYGDTSLSFFSYD